MRALIVLCLLASLPAVSAAAVEGPQVVYYDYDYETGPVYAVSADAGTLPAPGCADCEAWGAHVGAETDGASYVNVDAKLCRSAFFYFCVVDEDITVSRN